MTPGARIAAAIECLDAVLEGAAAERVLTTWARRHRFAGSRDRAAIRDLVFDALRRLRSSAALGGSMTGRGVMIGLLRGQGTDPRALFTGEGYAPAPISPGEEAAFRAPDPLEALDCPAWLVPLLQESLGEDFEPVMEALRHRAPVFLRVNTLRTDLAGAQAALATEGIATRPHALSPTALEVLEGARKIAASGAFRDGLVELQDAASQAVADMVPVEGAGRVLDFCAGGGGKTLALAPRCGGTLFAHDAEPKRMADLPARAARAGVAVRLRSTAELSGETFDVVMADAPCSGSGAWRRAPDGKWRLTRDRLDQLVALQAEILDRAAALVAENGVLAYATCSILAVENAEQVTAFRQRHPGWTLVQTQNLTPPGGGDGFFIAVLQRNPPVVSNNCTSF